LFLNHIVTFHQRYSSPRKIGRSQDRAGLISITELKRASAIGRACRCFVSSPRTDAENGTDLLTAQQQACAIGAGFFEDRSGEFYQYPGTRLETRPFDTPDETADIAA
jgi:hypothetical protein